MEEEFSLLKKKSFSHGKYSISSIRMSDAESLRIWRNDQIDALRQSQYLSSAAQKKYFEKVIKVEFPKTNPSLLLVRFTLNNKFIGYGGLVHINWTDQRAEVSFLLETGRSKNTSLYVSELKIFMLLIQKLAFEHLDFNKLTTESFDHRDHHVKAIEECGFQRDGVLRQHTKVDGGWVNAILCSRLSTEFQEYQN